MKRKTQPITLSIKPGVKEKLEQIALDLGFKWGENPNVSALLNAIAAGDLVVIQPEVIESQISTIKEAIKYFADLGDFEKVCNLASIMKKIAAK